LVPGYPWKFMDFLIANLTYVSLRLFITGNLVLLFASVYRRWVGDSWSWYLAVITMAQCSFWMDYIIFSWTLFKPVLSTH
jgi:hypothetical protein